MRKLIASLFLTITSFAPSYAFDIIDYAMLGEFNGAVTLICDLAKFNVLSSSEAEQLLDSKLEEFEANAGADLVNYGFRAFENVVYLKERRSFGVCKYWFDRKRFEKGL